MKTNFLKIAVISCIITLSFTTATNSIAQATERKYPRSANERYDKKDRDKDKDKDERKKNKDEYKKDKDYNKQDKDRRKDWDKDDDGKEVTERLFPLRALGIPKGHLPPPGECKIWIPGKPAGQQGPPTSCNNAYANVPLGGWVITHEGERYKVNIFNRRKRSVVDEVRYYQEGE